MVLLGVKISHLGVLSLLGHFDRLVLRQKLGKQHDGEVCVVLKREGEKNTCFN